MEVLLQIAYIVILVLIGLVILFMRRQAKGGKSLFKLALILLGILLAVVWNPFQQQFLQSVAVILLIVLVFELSSRLNKENITLNHQSTTLFLGIIFTNMIFITIISYYLFNLSTLNALILGILISTIEYFMVVELKQEGDLSTPFLLVMTTVLLVLAKINFDSAGATEFIKYLMIGLGTGIVFGIIVFSSMKKQNNTFGWFHEVGLVCGAIILYIVTEYLQGAGVLAVVVFGIFFGNSYIRKQTMHNGFSPFIFKTTELLILLLVGFFIHIRFDAQLLWKSAIIMIAYVFLRFIIISIVYKKHSIHNKLLLTIAPKGMVFAVMILFLAPLNNIEETLILCMALILMYSLILSSIVEYTEKRKIAHFEKVFAVIKNLRFGRKRR